MTCDQLNGGGKWGKQLLTEVHSKVIVVYNAVFLSDLRGGLKTVTD